MQSQEALSTSSSERSTPPIALESRKNQSLTLQMTVLSEIWYKVVLRVLCLEMETPPIP